MKEKVEIIIKNPTREKTKLVDERIDAIVNTTKTKFTIDGFTIRRIKNIFIIL